MSASTTLYFTPGPVPISQRTSMAMHELLYHKSEQFSMIHEELKASLRHIIHTDSEVLIAPGSGTTAAEIIMRGMVPHASRLLMLVNGRFSSRWSELGMLFGHDIHILETHWGTSFSEELLEDMLAKETFHSVWITHTETSTGITIPLEQYCSIIHRHSPETFIIVDAVSSLILESINMQSYGVDCLFSASQKALAAPPGACIMALSDRAMRHCEENAYQHSIQQSMVHDLLSMIQASKHAQPRFTPPLPIISALYASCREIVNDPAYQEKLKMQSKRIREMIMTWKGCSMNQGHYSTGVSVVHHEKAEEIVESLKQYGIIIAGGQDAWKSQVFRIGHMVIYSESDLQRLDNSMQEILEHIA